MTNDNKETFDLSAMFADADEDQGLSLDRLSETYAEAIGEKPVPFASEEKAPDEAAETDERSTADLVEQLSRDAEETDPCEVSPTTILEALLFVGNSANEDLDAEKAASVMRGVQPSEIEDLVAQLNQRYEEENCPYEIVSVGSHYRMTLREAFRPLREKFYGKLREAKLSQPAIDVLSLVAYRQGVTREEVDEIRGKPSGPILNQLVRRQLLRVQYDTENRRLKRYITTDRFLRIFGLATLDDLPQPQSLED